MIYLVHLDKPMFHAKHYVGYSKGSFKKRLERHRAGGGSKLLKAAKEQGIGYEVVRTWPGNRTQERQLKRQKNTPRYCPICQEQHSLGDKHKTKPFQGIAKTSGDDVSIPNTGRRRVIGRKVILVTPKPGEPKQKIRVRGRSGLY